MKKTIGILATISIILAGFMFMTAGEEKADAKEQPERTAVEMPEEVTEIEEVVPAFPLSDEERDLVERIVAAEARGECIEAQVAVAQTILDRCNTRNQTVTEVCTAKYQFAKPYQGEIPEKTQDAVRFVFDNGDRVFDLVTHFYAWELIDPPEWTKSKVFKGRIGGTDFYADK